MNEMRTLNGYEVVDGWAREEILRLKEASNTPTDVKYFDIDDNGIIALKPKYRGCPPDDTYPLSDNGAGIVGSEVYNLPKRIVIPETINNMPVTALIAGMFAYNPVVEEVVLPNTVKVIPEKFCYNAHYFKAITNTEHITEIGESAFSCSRIEQAIFPNLETMGIQAFAQSIFLHTVDIGKVTTINIRAFIQCASLQTIKGGENVTTIKEAAFNKTVSLKCIPFLSLSKVAAIEKTAFVSSSVYFDWSKLTNCTFGTYATPVVDNTTDYWSNTIGNYLFTPCENRLVTLLDQRHPLWVNEYFGTTSKTWKDCCGVFCVLHIHSALSGKKYATPFEFEAELGANEETAALLSNGVNHSGETEAFYTALGYETEKYTDTLNETAFRAMLDALADGAYVHISVSTTNNPNSGHAIIAYGINEKGEIMFADSDTKVSKVEAYNDKAKMTYQLAFQNITGPSSDFVIVRKPKHVN